jgi:hypothetical protein
MTFEARPALKPLKVENTVMEITARALWNLIHCLGFGVLYLLACSGALVELYRLTIASPPSESTPTLDESRCPAEVR